MDMYQLHIGTEKNIWEHPIDPTYTDSVWISQIIREMYEYDIQIFRPHALTIPPARQNDKALMDIFFSNKIPCRELYQLNTFRQYKKMHYTSDITMANGQYLTPHALTNKQSQSSLTWPHIPTPPKYFEKTWQKWIVKTLCQNNNMQLYPEFEVGKWISPHTKIHTIYPNMFSMQTSSIYEQDTNGYKTSFCVDSNRKK